MYIYIIHSKQFGKNVYKVGYTSNLTNRIKSPCYTTCFYEPCEYKKTYKFSFKNGYPELNPESIEKDLHKQLKSPIYKKIKNLRDHNNTCEEMYKSDIVVLSETIESILNNMKNISYEEFDFKNSKEELLCLLANGEYLGYDKFDRNGSKCCLCNHPMKNIYKIKCGETFYVLGSNCYKDLYNKNVREYINETIIKINQEFNLAFSKEILESNEYFDYLNKKFNFKSKKDEILNSTKVRSELFLKSSGNKIKEDHYGERCNCNIKYNLYRLSKLFQKNFSVDKQEINKWKLSPNHKKKFYDSLSKLDIFNISNDFITLKVWQSQMLHIDQFFSNYKYLNTYKINEHKNEHKNEYEFSHIKEIAYSNHVSSENAYDKLFLYNKSILSGCAGSGKTTSVFGSIHFEDDSDYGPRKPTLNKSKIYKYFDKAKKVLVLAFTGKARSVIENKFKECITKYNDLINDYDKDNFKYLKNMRCKFSTIDSYLVNNQEESFEYVIIDEISMIKIDQLYNIIKRLPNSNYLLLGDENQLEPVGGPSVMKELIKNCCGNTINNEKYIFSRINECKRTEVPDLKGLFEYISNDINKCNIENIKKYCKDNNVSKNIKFIYIDELKNIIKNSNQDTKILTHNNEIRLKIYEDIKSEFNISNIKETYMCTQNLYTYEKEDEHILKLLKFFLEDSKEEINTLKSSKEEINTLKSLYKELDKKEADVLLDYIKKTIKDNEEEKCLLFYNGKELIFNNGKYNGDIILTLKTLKFLQILLSFVTNKKFLYENSNTMTVHKSQGSGYHTVIIDARYMKHEALYTATTRAINSIYYIINKPNITNIQTKTNEELKNKLLKLAKIMTCNLVLKNTNENLTEIINTIKNLINKGNFMKFTQKEHLNLTSEEAELYERHGITII